MKKSIVYTKTGDKGTTSLIGGTRVPKNHYRLEAYGTIDELNSFIGMLLSFELDDKTRKMILNIQNKLFVIGAYLATDNKKNNIRKPIQYDISIVEELEVAMDEMDETLPPLKYFVLPGGHQAVSYCHIVRTICRRAERIILSMSEQTEVNEIILKYINRLSDYFFVLSRFLSKKFNVKENYWKPDL